MYDLRKFRSLTINTIHPTIIRLVSTNCTRYIQPYNTIKNNHVYHRVTVNFKHQCILQSRSFSSITIPAIADSINEGTVASIEKSVGDPVAIDDVVIILETDKVSVDVKSQVNGTIESINCAIGDTVKVGDTIINVNESSSSKKKSSTKTQVQSGTSATQRSNKSDTKLASSNDKSQSTTESTPSQSQQSTNESTHHRTPLIKFTHGRANLANTQPPQSTQQQQVPSKQTTAFNPTNNIPVDSTFNSILLSDSQFQSDNDRAYHAYLQLPQRYKRKPFNDATQIFIQFGGADDYLSRAEKKQQKS